MKAWVLHGVGDIRYEEVEKPKPRVNEVLVRVKACGICGSDIPRVYKDGAHNMPLVIGHEFAGEVCDAGSDTGRSWLGKRVGVFPLIPCGVCEPCQNHKYEMCRNYDYLGSRRDGGFAEYVAVPTPNLIELPDCVVYEEAAMLEPLSVALHAIRRVDIDVDESYKVIGIGTVGFFVTMMLAALGVKTLYPVCNKSIQRGWLDTLGLKPTSGEEEADVVFDCVGSNQVYEKAVDTARPGGKVVLVGNPGSDMTLNRNVYWKILRNQLTLFGTWNSTFTGDKEDDWHTVIGMLNDKRINPSCVISHRLELPELEQGLQMMRDKAEEYGKVMVAIN